MDKAELFEYLYAFVRKVAEGPDHPDLMPEIWKEANQIMEDAKK